MALSMAGCYWLTSYRDLLAGNGDAGADVQADVAASRDAASADAGPFCPPGLGPNVYCMDFDDVDAASLGLQTYEADAGLTDVVSVSPPGSLFVKLDGPDTGTAGSYSVAFSFIPTTSRLEFEINVATLGSWITTPAISLYEASTQTWRSLQFLVTPEGAFSVQEYIDGPSGGQGYGHEVFPADGGLPTGTWHHVVMTLTVNDATKEYTSGVTFDGEVIEDNMPLQGPWAQGTATITVGSSWAQAGGSLIFFDNVRADFGL